MATKISRHIEALPEHPEMLSAALAHVLRIEGDREIVLGQAWLAQQNKMVTCGHVVEQYVSSPFLLAIQFPASGNRYAVGAVQMHPSFVRQPDQLVKYDVAVLEVALSQPESTAKPLPISFERPLKANQALAAFRYPVHLGALSAAPEPLAQGGSFLGFLRKHDNFHLLHDLPLAPGDSGAAIFDGPSVAAIHCGDTASLPGLNLPTTSIRMALWIDSLRDLGIRPSAPSPSGPAVKPLLSGLLAALAAALVSLVLVLAFTAPGLRGRWTIQPPGILPVDVSFNKALNTFKTGDQVQIVLSPRSDCYLYLFDVDAEKHVLTLYPPFGMTAFVKAGEARTVDRFGRKLLKVNAAKDTLHVVGLISDYPLVRGSDWNKSDPAATPLTIDGDELTDRLERFQKADPGKIVHLTMAAPSAQ